MLIAIDIGNSSIKLGYYAGQTPIVQKINTASSKKATNLRILINDFISKNNLENTDISCIISSVVPEFTAVIAEAVSGLSDKNVREVLTVDHTMRSDVTIMVDNPDGFGADRIANAEAAYSLYSGPVAVADCGTATTITFVDRSGHCLGGAILPGVGLMNKALGLGASKLGEVELRRPAVALGRNTGAAILSGLVYGTAGAIERVIADIEQETGGPLGLVITGGYGGLVEEFVKRPHFFRPDLTLLGLRTLYDKNRRP